MGANRVNEPHYGCGRAQPWQPDHSYLALAPSLLNQPVVRRSLHIVLLALSVALAHSPAVHAQKTRGAKLVKRQAAQQRAAQKRGKKRARRKHSKRRHRSRLQRVAQRRAALRAREAAVVEAASPVRVGMLRALFLETPKLTVKALRKHPKQFLRGVFIDGPKHAYKDVKNNKLILAGGLGVVAVLSGVAEMNGVSIHWPLVGLTTYLVALKNRNVVNRLRLDQLSDSEAAHTLGAHAIMPALLTGSASVAGLGFGHGGDTAAAVKAAAAQKFVTGASGGTVIASDGPVLGALLKAESARERAKRAGSNPRIAPAPKR